MGDAFKHTEQYLGETNNTMFLEIGSDRHEGSTEYFSRLAQKHGAEMHTVDIIDEPKRRLPDLPATWHIGWGSDWCVNQLPKLDKKISCLYLDNFDYIWDIDLILDDSDIKQRRFYREELGIPLANQTCQVEHMKQMIAIFPYLTDDAVVVFDDTHTLNDCWVGKCGANVIWLLAQGFEIVRQDFFEYGVIMKRHKIK
jgi:hypothetical protein